MKCVVCFHACLLTCSWYLNTYTLFIHVLRSSKHVFKTCTLVLKLLCFNMCQQTCTLYLKTKKCLYACLSLGRKFSKMSYDIFFKLSSYPCGLVPLQLLYGKISYLCTAFGTFMNGNVPFPSHLLHLFPFPTTLSVIFPCFPFPSVPANFVPHNALNQTSNDQRKHPRSGY